MKKEIILYHYWRSSASWRVRWALELKKVAHKKIAVDLLKSEEKKAEYTRHNPSGYLPCLVIGDKALAESLSIIEWLEETYPDPTLFDGDSFKRALIRQLAETVNSGTQPMQNLDVMRRYSAEKEKQTEWNQHWIMRGLAVYEKILLESGIQGTKFSVSNHPTIADLCLIPQCYTALRFQVNLADYPRCKAVYDHALTTPECIASSPEKFQPVV